MKHVIPVHDYNLQVFYTNWIYWIMNWLEWQCSGCCRFSLWTWPWCMVVQCSSIMSIVKSEITDLSWEIIKRFQCLESNHAMIQQPKVASSRVTWVTQSHTGLHDRPIENFTVPYLQVWYDKVCSMYVTLGFYLAQELLSCYHIISIKGWPMKLLELLFTFFFRKILETYWKSRILIVR